MAARKKCALTPEEQLEAALVPESEWPYEVPENWCWTRIHNVAEVVTGNTPSKKRTEYYGDSIPFFKPADLDAGRHVIEPTEYLSEAGGKVARVVPAQSTAVCCIGSIGKCGFLEVDGCTNQQINTAIPKIDPLYLYYFMTSECFTCQLWDKSSATTISIVNKSKMSETYIPLPPLHEQRRIASRIEWLFAKLDDAEAELREVIDGSEQRRATTLHRAFTGELTKDWRGNHLSTRDEWKIVRYSSLGSSKLGKMLDRAKNAGEDTPYLRNINVRWFDYQLSDLASMRASEQEREIYSVKPGDLLICEGGEPGRCAVWKGEAEGLIFQKALHRFRPNEDVSSDYIAYYLYYLSLSDGLAKYFTGTTIKHLTGKSLAKIEISLPPVEEQNEIVRLLDALMQREKDASSLADKALIQIQELRATILDKALRGELGTNDPGEPSSKELLASMLSGNTDQ